MKIIKTICGKDVLVDDEDYDYINLYDLHVNKNNYVICKPKKKYKKMGLFSSMALHKVLMLPEKTGRSINVDHKDGNELNNQKSNLRVCTHQENMFNRKLHSHSKCKYKGLAWKKSIQKYEVKIQLNKKCMYIGVFENEIAAANAYNYYAKLYFGEFARLNDVPYMPKEEWEKYSMSNKKSSKFRGVFWDKRTGKYVSQIWDGKRNIKIGEFDDEEEAALAYNKKALELKGDKAILNMI